MSTDTTTAATQMLRLTEVSQITTLSGMTIRRLVKNNQFPAPINLTPRTTVWRLRDINKWIENGGCSDD